MLTAQHFLDTTVPPIIIRDDRIHLPFINTSTPIIIVESDSDETEVSKKGSLVQREKRKSYCGLRLGKKFSAKDGKYKKGQHHCNLWRDEFCPSCFNHRLKYYKGQIQSSVYRATQEGRFVKMVTVDEGEARFICARVKKEDYRRFPQEDSTVVFFIDSEDVDIGEPVIWADTEDSEIIPWEQIIKTPKNRHATGTMGKDLDVLEEGEALIKNPDFTVDPSTTEEQEIKALTATFEQTKQLNPETPEELETALKERADVFVKELAKAGGKLLHGVKFKTEKVKISLVQWIHVQDLFDIQRMVYGENWVPDPIGTD